MGSHYLITACKQFIHEDQRKAFFPIPYGFMSKLKASHQKEFCHLSVTQLVTQSAQQDLEDDIGRKFQKIEGIARAFIGRAMTILALEDSISEGRRAL